MFKRALVLFATALLAVFLWPASGSAQIGRSLMPVVCGPADLMVLRIRHDYDERMMLRAKGFMGKFDLEVWASADGETVTLIFNRDGVRCFLNSGTDMEWFWRHDVVPPSVEGGP